MQKRFTLTLLSGLFALSVYAGPGGALEFVENRGQWDGAFRYKASAGGNDVYLETGGFTYVVAAPGNAEVQHAHKHGRGDTTDKLRFHAYRAAFEGAALQPQITCSKPQPHYYNYFLGNNPTRWQSNIHPVAAVDYTALYPGVDAHVASANGRMKYEFVVAAGGDASQIRLRYDGVDGISVKDGALHIVTSVGTVQEAVPVVYQVRDGERVSIPCRYKVRGTVVSYEFPRGYDEGLPLVIDPTVVFSTYSGSTADNWGMTATYDDSSNFYAGGIAMAPGYPTSTGAFDVSYNGGSTPSVPSDMAISKFSATGTTLIYSTYIGGSEDEQPNSLFVDGSGNLAIVGRTLSANFPTTANAYDASYNGGTDIAVVKLNATGTALVGSTFLGGSLDDGNNISFALSYNYGDDARSEVICDAAGNVYLAASTESTNFPIVSAFQNINNGGQEAVVAKLNANLSALTWSTYLGGAGDDAAYVLALDRTGTNLFVAGGTESTGFPASFGALNLLYQGGDADGFIVKYTNGGTYPMTRGTFIGRSDYDQCFGIQVDSENSVYAMGQTLGGTFPVTAGVYSNPGSTQFVIKLDSNLSSIVYSTVFGSGSAPFPNISPVAFLVDSCQNVYISGWGGTLGGGNFNNSGTTGLPTTPSQITLPLKNTTDGNDFYFFTLSKNAISLLYGAFLGGTQSAAMGNGEHVDGGTSRFDRKGVIYQAVCAGCNGSMGSAAFPTTSGAFSQTNGSSNCNLGATKIAFNLGAVDAAAQANPTAKGCPPLTVNFSNGSSNATSYEWDFGDGSATSTVATPTHVYTTMGNFTARLIAINPNACKVRDTVYIPITVDTNAVNAAFTAQVLDSCGPYRVSFANTSQYSSTPGAQTFTQFLWLFGDGTQSSAANPGVHTYPDTGTYNITLVQRDTTACNNPDTARLVVRIRGFRVTAGFNAPNGCISAGLGFVSTSANASSLLWRFGDGTTGNTASPVHTYATAGTYTVTHIASNPASCNKVDSVTQSVQVRASPIADFYFEPVIPIANTPVQFTNTSINAASFFWGFGDGTNSVEVNPSHLFKRTGTYTVCLTAKSTDGCLDTICKNVDADIIAAADVPTAFSPNGDGSNDVLYVRGAAMETLDFRVYNRWGEMVFQTANENIGWDGKYKGKPAEIDAYAFVLYVSFIDGTSLRKTGNVTLVR